MRVALGIVVGVVIVLVSFTLVVHGQGMTASPGLSDNFYSANGGLNDFKMKMAQIMGSANQGKENSVNVEDQGTTNDFNANVSDANSSDVNRSANNQSAHDLSTVNPIPFESAAPNTSAFNSSESSSSESEQPQLASSQNSSSVNQSLENRTSGIQPGKNSTSKTGFRLRRLDALPEQIRFRRLESISIIKPPSTATGPCRPAGRALGIAE